MKNVDCGKGKRTRCLGNEWVLWVREGKITANFLEFVVVFLIPKLLRRIQRAEFYSHYFRYSNMIEWIILYIVHICSTFSVFALLLLQEYRPPWLT